MLYKKLIQRRILAIKRKNSTFRNAHLAEKLGIEASYLSRFFSDSKVNFSDELLFDLLNELQMNKNQIEQILTLRELSNATSIERKRFLEERLKVIRLQGIRGEIALLRDELVDLLNLLPHPRTEV